MGGAVRWEGPGSQASPLHWVATRRWAWPPSACERPVPSLRLLIRRSPPPLLGGLAPSYTGPPQPHQSTPTSSVCSAGAACCTPTPSAGPSRGLGRPGVFALHHVSA